MPIRTDDGFKKITHPQLFSIDFLKFQITYIKKKD
jgi:hypothetical protein